MSLGKVKNIFDPTDLGCEDNVGAYLRSSDGTLLTHTTFGGVEALDVNIANTSPIDVNIASGIELEISECYTDLVTGRLSLTASEGLIGGVTDRCSITIFNIGQKDAFFGKTGLTDTDGFCIPCGGSYDFKAGATPLYALCASGETTELCFIEHVK